MIFAQTASNTVSDPVLLGTIGVVSALLAGFFKVIQNQTKANENLSDTMKKMAQSNENVAKEIRKGNEEAKERNGHLGEQSELITKLIVESRKELKADLDRNHRATKKIKEQHVDEQHIHTQIMDKNK